jgi:hypothetical protein
LFKANRRYTLELLGQLPWLWEKTLLVPNPQGGQQQVRVAEVVEMQSHHVDGHVEDIRKIRQKFRR